MSNHSSSSRNILAGLAAGVIAAGAVTTSLLGAPTALADATSYQIWTMANDKHVAAGCQPYDQVSVLNDEAFSRAKTMITFPKGTIAGTGLYPTDTDLAGKGYYVTSWGEADYQNNAGRGSPQAAMDFWMANPTSQIFGNCNNHDLATAYYVQGNQWAAVLIAASPGGTPPPAPEQPH